MKTKKLLKWIFILLVISPACSRDDIFPEHKTLSSIGEKFMQVVYSSPDWEKQWT